MTSMFFQETSKEINSRSKPGKHTTYPRSATSIASTTAQNNNLADTLFSAETQSKVNSHPKTPKAPYKMHKEPSAPLAVHLAAA